MADRPSKVRSMPPAAVDARPGPQPDHEAELHDRLATALAALPEAERTAVVAAYGYAGGSVGAAIELDLGPDGLADADAVTRNGLQLLRAALSDLDAHGDAVS